MIKASMARVATAVESEIIRRVAPNIVMVFGFFYKLLFKGKFFNFLVFREEGGFGFNPNFIFETEAIHRKSNNLVDIGVKSTSPFIYVNQKVCRLNSTKATLEENRDHNWSLGLLSR